MTCTPVNMLTFDFNGKDEYSMAKMSILDSREFGLSPPVFLMRSHLFIAAVWSPAGKGLTS